MNSEPGPPPTGDRTEADEENIDQETGSSGSDEETSSQGSSSDSDSKMEDENESVSDEEDSDSEGSSDMDDSSDDSHTDDSVWEELVEGDEGKSHEAQEALVLQEFQSGLDCLADGRKVKAMKIFKNVLRNPLVSCHHTCSFDWNVDGDADERLSKMARVFVGVHKNLATLDTAEAFEHYLQVLAVAPRNPQIWIDLAMKCVEKGDLVFAAFALQKSGSGDATEAKIGVLYLGKQYHACLELIKETLDRGVCSKKALFLRERIRSINQHYREFSDKLFCENRHYEDNYTKLDIDTGTAQLFASSLSSAEQYQRSIPIVDPETELSPILIPIEAEYSYGHVCTIFCDLFDRIQAYSSLACQVLSFSKWEDRQEYLDTCDTMNSMLDVLDVVDTITLQTGSARVTPSPSDDNANSSKENNRDLFKRRSIRIIGAPDVDVLDEDEDENGSDVVEQTDSQQPSNRLASALDLCLGCIVPLRSGLARPSRTPTPSDQKEFIDEDTLLLSLRHRLSKGNWSIYDLIATVLLELASICPEEGALPKHLHPVVTQLYRRLNMMQSNLEESKWLRLHVLMDDLDEAHGRDYCIRNHYFNGWKSRGLALRFAWNHARLSTSTSIRITFLSEIEKILHEDEVVMTAKGYFCNYDVNTLLEKLNKNDRVLSIRELRAAKMHKAVVEIVEQDVDLDSIEEDEMLEMVGYWIDGLVHMESHQKAIDLLNRLLDYLLSLTIVPEAEISRVLQWVDQIKFTDVSKTSLETLGFMFCRLSGLFSTNWMVWKTLYEVVRTLEGCPTIDYILSLDSSTDDGAMPCRALDVLLKAHEDLGEASLCGQDKGTFLEFYMAQLYELISDQPVLETLLLRENAWLWANVLEEISQCLYCSFGKYGKKRKVPEEHSCKSELPASTRVAEVVVPLAMPYPMPLYDDKERLGQDVVELLQSKFPFLLEVSSKRKEDIDGLHEWLKSDPDDTREQEKISWPQKRRETELQARIWYVMALHSFRQNSHSDTYTYAQLFLTSGHATYDNRLTVSAWAMLAHSTIYGLFQLQDEQILEEWRWRTMPFRIALHVCDNSLAVLHFQLGNALYQVATCVSRFIKSLPLDDFRRRRSSCVRPMRLESQLHFESALALTQPTTELIYEEFHWLCYFFLAKLYAKLDTDDVLKVVDCLFEAACSCQLANFFYYPTKINTKKQQNIEPVELHYHVYSVVWKYISSERNPDIEVLAGLLSYARAFQSHKVVRANASLFACHPELHEVMINLTLDVEAHNINDSAGCQAEERDLHIVSNNLLSRVDLLDELWTLCMKGFEQVCERFPHPKARYRMAEMEVERGNMAKASEHILKGVFRRKKKEDSFFDNCIELTSKDIDRSGSYGFHVERSLRLAASILHRLKDVSNLAHILMGLYKLITEEDYDMLPQRAHRPLVNLFLWSFRSVMSNQLTPAVKVDVSKLWKTLDRQSENAFLCNMRVFVRNTIQRNYGPIANFVADQLDARPPKRKIVKKRKLTSFDLARSQPSPQPVPPIALTLSQPDDDVQVVEDPLMLMRMALQAAGGMF